MKKVQQIKPRQKRIITDSFTRKELSYSDNSYIIQAEISSAVLYSAFQEARDGYMSKLLEIYRKIASYDSRISGILKKRKRKCLMYPMGVFTSSGSIDSICKEINQVLEKIKIKKILKKGLDGRFYGIKIIEMGLGMEDGKIVPKIFRPVNNNFIAQNNESVKLSTGNNLRKGIPGILLESESEFYSLEDDRKFGKYKFLKFIEDDEDGYHDLSGTLRPVIKMFMLKFYVTNFWAQVASTFGHPVTVVKIPRSDYTQYREEINAFLSNVGRNKYGILFKEHEYEIRPTTTTGDADLLKDLIEYCDTEIEISILSQSGTTQLKGGGSYGAVGEYKQDELDIIIDDADFLSETITDDLVRPYIMMNYPEKNPLDYNFKIKTPKKVDIKSAAMKYESIGRSFGGKLKVSKRDIEEDFGVSVKSDEEYIEVGQVASAREPNFQERNSEIRKETRTDTGED